MTCCPSNIIPFSNVSTTDIIYGESMLANYGRVPKVQVLYKNGSEYYIAQHPIGVRLSGNPVENIHVDHGGISSGLIKIL